MTLYIVGLIMVAVAVAHEFTQTLGWAVLGAGLMLQAVFVGISDYILDYLDQRKEASRDE
jgi:hypothetical protein